MNDVPHQRPELPNIQCELTEEAVGACPAGRSDIHALDFEAFYVSGFSALCSWFAKRCGWNDAEDLALDTFVKTYRLRENCETLDHLRNTLYQIARYRLLNWLRDKRRNRTVSLEDLRGPDGEWGIELPADGAPLDDRACALYLEEKAWQVLAGLPPEFREALMQIDVAEMSYAEAARKMDLAEGTLKSRVHRGRIMLRSRLNSLIEGTDGRGRTC